MPTYNKASRLPAHEGVVVVQTTVPCAGLQGVYGTKVDRGAFVDNAKLVEANPKSSLVRPDMRASMPSKVRHLIEAGWLHSPQARPSMSEIVAYLTQLCQEEGATQ